MTPADLEALGVRVKPLEWATAVDDGRRVWGGLHDYEIWEYQEDNAFVLIGASDGLAGMRWIKLPTLEAAIAAANAHHAAWVAAMIEVNE